MKLDDLRDALETAGLGRLTPYLDRLMLPAIRIESSPALDQDLPIGVSRLGGRPDLPQAFEWPRRESTPLSFLAQFNLTEIHPYDVNRELPSSGMLSFFYEFETNRWGIYPHDRDAWRVSYFEDLSTLSRRPWPLGLPSYYCLPAREPWFSTMTTITDEPDWAAGIPITDAERLQLSEAIKSLLAPQDEERFTTDDMPTRVATRHELLGYPWISLHRRMPETCELAANRHVDTSPVLLDIIGVLPEAKRGDVLTKTELEQAYKRWRLLFQLGNISGLSFPEDVDDEDSPYWKFDLWARGGLMYFWIERERLASRDFSNVWMLGASQL